MRNINERAVKLYELFAAEMKRWRVEPVIGSEWNDKGTIRHLAFYAIQRPAASDFIGQDMATECEYTETHEIIRADLVQKYVCYCAMEDALERFNGED